MNPLTTTLSKDPNPLMKPELLGQSKSRLGRDERRRQKMLIRRCFGGSIHCGSLEAIAVYLVCFFHIAVFLLVCTAATTTATSTNYSESFNPNDWYKRYPAYPPYCSTPEEMATRSIPPLHSTTSSSNLDDAPSSLQLVQATIVVRHGARTPYSGSISCWENYRQADTGRWDCHLTTLMAPPSPKSVVQQEEETSSFNGSSTVSFLFEKRYDALNDPADNLSNELPGTCQVGQLLLQGYEQELTNGQHLRQAYLDNKHDPRMNLFPSTNRRTSSSEDSTSTWPWNGVYYRADDDQRTLMSGQVLLRGLLGPDLERYYNQSTSPSMVNPVVIPLHTADRARDVMDANEAVCPQLGQLHQLFASSTDYQAYQNSAEVQLLQRFIHEVLKVDQMSAVDCLMTTICTDRTLPDALNDYKGPTNNHSSDYQPTSQHPYGTNLFQRLFQYDAQSMVRLFQFQDAAYSKLALTPLWTDIMANIQGIMNASSQVCCPARAPPKLAIYSGHDTTLMPLLASLGGNVYDGSWAPYASMVAIELYHITPLEATERAATMEDDYYFRLVHNGKVLTPLMDGCESKEVCPIRVLIEQVSSFTFNVSCFRQDGSFTASPATSPAGTQSGSSDVFSSPGGIAALCLLVVGSALFGSLSTYLYVAGRTARDGGRHRVLQTDHDEEGISMHLHHDSVDVGVPSRNTTLS